MKPQQASQDLLDGLGPSGLGPQPAATKPQPLCSACDPDGWQCERPLGHSGNHACGHDETAFAAAEAALAAVDKLERDQHHGGQTYETGQARSEALNQITEAADRSWYGNTRWRQTQNRVWRAWEEQAEQTERTYRTIARELGLTIWSVRRHVALLRKEGLI